MQMALFQPDIPHNVGASIRLSACLGVPLEVIGPCGFLLSDKKLKRVALDYGPEAQLTYHEDWKDFLQSPARDLGRLILLSTRGHQSLEVTDFAFGDTLIFGRETQGVPDDVRALCSLAVTIPIKPATRSLNLSVAAGIAVFEALRISGQLPKKAPDLP